MEERLRGAEFADSVERQIAGAVQGVGEWWQDASADQEGWGDDALRLLAGGVKNVKQGWQSATADQEGVFDDLLRLTEGGVKNTFRVLDAGSFYGGEVGGQFAKMIGFDPRIGGFVGNVAGDALLGFGIGKATQIGKTTARMQRLRKLGATDWQLDAITKGQYSMASVQSFGDLPAPSFIDDVATSLKSSRKTRRRLTNLERNILKEADIKQQAIDQAWEAVDRAKARGSGNIDNYIRNVRSIQGTPGEAMELAAKEFVENATDPRISERVGMRGAYGKRIGKKAYERGEFPQFKGQQIPKPLNAALRKEGLEQSVEAHHLISNYDSATLDYQLSKLGAIAKHEAYEYILNKYKIVPGDFDLNLTNIPTGVHRLQSGGDLHTWLDRMGFEDYWRTFSKNNPGPVTKELMAKGVDTYFDEVFYPMMVKLQQLLIDNPAKFKWEGFYFPEYLVDDAKARLKHLQKPNRPQRLRGSRGGVEEAVEGQIEQAYKAGEGLQGQRYWESIDGIQIDAQPGYGFPTQKKKVTRKRK